MTRKNFGYRAASGLFMVGVAYVVVVAIGISQAGLDEPIVDPILALMEILTLLAAAFVVALMAAIHGYAGAEHRIHSLLAFGFAVAMAVLTSAVHFVALTAGRQTTGFVLQWPSIWYAAELLAWDVFLGLSLLFASFVFQEKPADAMAARAMAGTAVLCLLGALGPAIGDMGIQRLGVLGYGIGLPITCFLVARVFGRIGAGAPAMSTEA